MNLNKSKGEFMFKIEMNTNIISNDSWDIFFDKKYFDEQKFKTEDEAKDWCYNYVKRQERNGIELCDADFIIYHTEDRKKQELDRQKNKSD